MWEKLRYTIPLESRGVPWHRVARCRITFTATKSLNREPGNFRFQGKEDPSYERDELKSPAQKTLENRRLFTSEWQNHGTCWVSRRHRATNISNLLSGGPRSNPENRYHQYFRCCNEFFGMDYLAILIAMSVGFNFPDFTISTIFGDLYISESSSLRCNVLNRLFTSFF